MVDNVSITTGSDATISTDDVAGVQYQRVKIDLGGDGLASPLVRGQQTAANSLPVTLPSDQGTLTVSGTVELGATAWAALETVTVVNTTLESLVQAEDAIHATGDKGIMALGVRNDAGSSFGADRDYIPVSLNGSGAVRVIAITGSTVRGEAAHDAAVAGNPLLVGGYASAAAPADVSLDGDAVRAWCLRNGAAATVLTAAGALICGDAANGLDVDVTRLPALAAGTNNIGDVDVLTVNAQAAHDAAIAGNPIRIAGRAETTEIAAVADGDTCDLMTDINGRLVVAPYAVPERLVSGSGTAITGTTAQEQLAAGAAGIRNYITSIMVTNSHATVGTLVEIRDGTTTVLWRGYAAPAGGGFSVQFPTPLKGTAATAVNAYNITTGANTYVNVAGFQGP